MIESMSILNEALLSIISTIAHMSYGQNCYSNLKQGLGLL